VTVSHFLTGTRKTTKTCTHITNQHGEYLPSALPQGLARFCRVLVSLVMWHSATGPFAIAITPSVGARPDHGGVPKNDPNYYKLAGVVLAWLGMCSLILGLLPHSRVLGGSDQLPTTHPP
jgi:hypothetical protein